MWSYHVYSQLYAMTVIAYTYDHSEIEVTSRYSFQLSDELAMYIIS